MSFIQSAECYLGKRAVSIQGKGCYEYGYSRDLQYTVF